MEYIGRPLIDVLFEDEPVSNLQQLRDRQRDQRNPGHELGSFLLAHSNSPEYLVSQLEAYLEAARADLAAEREFARRMLSGRK